MTTVYLWPMLIVLALVALCLGEEDVGTVIGIDLGTTYSCVGIYKNGRVEIIANDQGNRITPSYVAFKETGERLIGDGAKNQVIRNPANTIFDVKRLIGRTWDDQSLQNDIKYFPFKVVEEHNKPHIEVNVGDKLKRFAPEEVSSMVLMKMKDTAESYLGKKVTHAVVTVPAYFNDAQRRATKDAGTIAGLTVMRIINEPTAAAIAYGLDKQDEVKNILIFDLGGGTFDVSLMTINNGIFKVRAIDGDTHLGGEDFDHRIMDYFIKLFKTKTGHDIRKDNRAIQRLRHEVEKAKRVVSYQLQARIELDYLYGGDDFSETLTRAKFEDLNMDLFRLTLKPLEQVMKDSGIAKEDIEEIVLVGGSTRIPKIQQLVKNFFNGKEPSKGINPDEAVAYGAAVQGGILSGEDKFALLVLQDVTPLTLGISMHGDVMAPVITRNTEIPCKNISTFTTIKDGQTEVLFPVFEGERPMTTENHNLGNFTLRGVPPAPAGAPQLDVSFEIDANGIVKVAAVDKASGNTAGITITSEQSSLTVEEIERMINDAEKFAEDDQKVKHRVLAKNELEKFAYSIKTQVEEEKIGGRISKSDRKKVNKAATKEIEWILEHPDELREVYEERHLELKELVLPILSNYMRKEEL
ncbi:LOW QUALITY PROTEIN: endoplasmic reticulum chaperone BiP-like [Amphiura filiformis]|uniref:LOW QUALITY PROTEIN: endoplasmic reticulum chaperone BiP-like n=1 Tax=Amphiura filiformis TaxID=82378 RepID=UPI003B2106D5